MDQKDAKLDRTCKKIQQGLARVGFELHSLCGPSNFQLFTLPLNKLLNNLFHISEMMES